MPSIKDLNIEKKFRNLKNFNEGHNNDDDDDDNNIGQSPGGNLPTSQYPSSSSRRDEVSLLPTPPVHQWLLQTQGKDFFFVHKK